MTFPFFAQHACNAPVAQDFHYVLLLLISFCLVAPYPHSVTHGSVVAREYGIPAVVGLERITERLTTGQLIRVDGSAGLVEVLEHEEEK